MKDKLKWPAVLLLLLCILPGILLGAGAAMPSCYSESYYAQLAPMYRRLRETEGKRLVVVGGSNVAFGLDTALMETLMADRGYDYKVCSFGLYGAVGVSTMLELSGDNLHEGDIVILALEPVDEVLSSYFGASAFWKCAEDAPELLLELNGAQQSAVLGGYLAYLQERWSICESGVSPSTEGVYARASFDRECNMVYPREGNALALGFDPTTPVDLAGLTVDGDFAGEVAAYCARARARGAEVYLSFSPVNRSALTDGSQEAVECFFQTFNTAFPCQIISDPNDYILDSGWFYDNNFHLNSAGAVLRTCRLAEDVLSRLGCYEAVDYPLPEMPASIARQPEAEEEENMDLFLLAPVVGDNGETLGYEVSGLTAEGLAQSRLTLPGSYRGKSVVSLAAGALEGADELVELTLPENIEYLPDGVFSGCTRLERLVLRHESKVCSVTEHTFDRAEQVKIYVSRAAYALYRDGQGCEDNPWSAYLDRVYAFD